MPAMAPPQLDCVCFTLIIDDIVFPDGRTCMAQLGGGGSQSLFAFQLVNAQRTKVGLAAGVGPDMPAPCRAWLEGIGVDTSGLLLHPRPTPRAWQVFEEDGRRTQVYRGLGDPCDALFEMLRPKFDGLPEHFKRSRNYHIGVHPLHPPLKLLSTLRQVAHAHGGVLSVEPYTAAEQPATPQQVSDLVSACDIFSPNELEAVSMVGPGTPEEILTRLLEAAGPSGASTVVLRRGEHGVLAASRAMHGGASLKKERKEETMCLEGVSGAGLQGNGLHASGQAGMGMQSHAKANGAGSGGRSDFSRHPQGEDLDLEGHALLAWAVPAVADTRVVDVTGCGNAFCGGFLASYDSSKGDILESALWGCVAASFMAEEDGVPKSAIPDLQVRAHQRLEALRQRATQVDLRMHATPSKRRTVSCTAASRSGSTWRTSGAPSGLRPWNPLRASRAGVPLLQAACSRKVAIRQSVTALGCIKC